MGLRVFFKCNGDVFALIVQSESFPPGRENTTTPSTIILNESKFFNCNQKKKIMCKLSQYYSGKNELKVNPLAFCPYLTSLKKRVAISLGLFSLNYFSVWVNLTFILSRQCDFNLFTYLMKV